MNGIELKLPRTMIPDDFIIEYQIGKPFKIDFDEVIGFIEGITIYEKDIKIVVKITNRDVFNKLLEGMSNRVSISFINKDEVWYKWKQKFK